VDYNLERQDWDLWVGLIWPKTRKRGGLLSVRQRDFRLRKLLELLEWLRDWLVFIKGSAPRRYVAVISKYADVCEMNSIILISISDPQCCNCHGWENSEFTLLLQIGYLSPLRSLNAF
jgi:hypothetical protein